MSGQFLTGNTTVGGVYYPAGTTRAQVGPDASRIGDHLWGDAGGSQVESTGPDVDSLVAMAQSAYDQHGMEAAVRAILGLPVVDPSQPETVVEEPSQFASVPVTEGGATGKPAGEIPPKGGPGSGKDVWAAYAAANDVEVGPDATRDDIIAALTAKDVPTEAKSAE